MTESVEFWLGRTVFVVFEGRHGTVIAGAGDGSGYYDVKLSTGEVVPVHVSGMRPTGAGVNGGQGEGPADG